MSGSSSLAWVLIAARRQEALRVERVARETRMRVEEEKLRSGKKRQRVVVLLDSLPEAPVAVSWNDVFALPESLPTAILAALEEHAKASCADRASSNATLVSLLAPLLDSSRLASVEGVTYLPIIRRKTKEQTVETGHNYDDNMDKYWTIDFGPTATEMVLKFDERCKTEDGYDYLRVYKDESHSSTWGANKYTGGRGGGSHNWPSLQGRPDLRIPAGKCVLYFHSDGGGNDWGFKVTASAVTDESVYPPAMPRTRAVSSRSM